MSQSKIPPTLSAMPAHILEKIVKNTDFLTKLVIRKVKPLRKTVKNEKTQVYQVGVYLQNEQHVVIRVTFTEKSPYDTDIFEYKQVGGGCLIEKGDFSKLIVDGDMNELIAADLSLILANPLVTIDYLIFLHSWKVLREVPVGLALSTLLSKIEETILKKRFRTLNVISLTIEKTKEPADIFKMLPYVTPGVLKYLECSTDDEDIDVGLVKQLPHFEHLERLDGIFSNVTADMWKQFEYMKSYEKYNSADIMVLIQAALDHGEDFSYYDFGVVDGFNIENLDEVVSHFAEPESYRDDSKYITMANGTDILFMQLFAYGQLKMSKMSRESFMLLD